MNDRTDVGIKHMMNLLLQKYGVLGIIDAMQTYKTVSMMHRHVMVVSSLNGSIYSHELIEINPFYTILCMNECMYEWMNGRMNECYGVVRGCCVKWFSRVKLTRVSATTLA